MSALEFDNLPRTASGTLEPMTVRVKQAAALSGLSRSRIYELIESGDLVSKKVGRCNLINYQSLKKLIAE